MRLRDRTVAYTALHYGKHYLEDAIEAVIPAVRWHIILYTPKPSYGYGTDMACPDTRGELLDITNKFSHVVWYEGDWGTESDHRGKVFDLLPSGTEFLVPVDADEVWNTASLMTSLLDIDTNHKGEVREWRATGFFHFWKSFHWYCKDEMAPVRLIDLTAEEGTRFWPGRVLHFGYALPFGVQRYKWAIHGHKAELRTDYDWLEMYRTWLPGRDDVHPTCHGIWNPRPFFPASFENWPRCLDTHKWRYEALIE